MDVIRVCLDSVYSVVSPFYSADPKSRSRDVGLFSPRLDDYADDRLLAERSACLQPLKAFHQH